MTTNSVWVASLLLATLAMMPAAAHVLELPNKIGLSGIEYLTVQRLYRGWAFARLVVVAALMSMLVLLFMVREFPTAFALAWVAFLCLIGTQLVFWTFTQPVNRVTANWTSFPATGSSCAAAGSIRTPPALHSTSSRSSRSSCACSGPMKWGHSTSRRHDRATPARLTAGRRILAWPMAGPPRRPATLHASPATRVTCRCAPRGASLGSLAALGRRDP